MSTLPAKVVSCFDLNPPLSPLQKSLVTLTVILMNECTVELKMALVAFHIQANQLYLRHIACRIIKPDSGQGHENLKALAICKNIPSLFLQVTELAEVQPNHSLNFRGSWLICGLDQITL